MHRLVPIRAVALLVVAVFGVHLSRFYLAADLSEYNCPHHVQPPDSAPHRDPGSLQGSMQHANHAMPQSEAAHPATQQGSEDSGMRCCCRHGLDGLITTAIVYRPATLAKAPLPDGIQGVPVAAGRSVLENDLNPPFIPPRV